MAAPTAAAEPCRTGQWCTGTVVEVHHPHPMAVVLRLDVPGRMPLIPGQHYVVRLTADDGYSASRSYSVASAPHDPLVELYVERLDEGEVSAYLADAVEVGDELELRGPIGGWFTWDGETPAAGVGGGTGVVPLISMLRHARHLGRPEAFQLAVSARRLAELPYADELIEAGAVIVLTREDGADGRAAGRFTAEELGELVAGHETFYVCGSAGFAEAASTLLTGLGVPAAAIRVERFGPTA